MNPPTQPAPQTKAFQSWRWIFLATILLAAVTSGLYIATVQAESHGAITGLTLPSNAPGTLTVSWEATSTGGLKSPSSIMSALRLER